MRTMLEYISSVWYLEIRMVLPGWDTVKKNILPSQTHAELNVILRGFYSFKNAKFDVSILSMTLL